MTVAGMWDVLDLTVEAALGASDAVYGTARYGVASYGGSALLPWVDIKCDVRSLRITRAATRDAVMTYRVQAGSLTLELFDPDRRYDPVNPDGPHAGRLAPNLPLRVRLAGRTVGLFYVDTIEHLRSARTTTITASDGITMLSLTATEMTRPSESSTDRVRAIHAAAASPLRPPLVVTGEPGKILQPSTLNGDLWSMILATAAADRALVAVLGDGTLLYRANWSKLPTSPVATFVCPHQASDVSAVFYDLTGSIDDKLLVNTATVRRVGTDGQTDREATASDPASVQTYGTMGTGESPILPLGNQDLQAWVDTAVREGAWPYPRLSEMTVSLTGTEAWAALTGAIMWDLDLADAIRIVDHDGVVGVEAVTGIDHDLTDGVYKGTVAIVRPLQVAGSGGYNSGQRYNRALAYA